MFDMDRELNKWREQLLVGGVYRSSDIDELEVHVLDAIDNLESKGLTQEGS